MSFRTHIPEDIRRATKVIGLAAWVDDPDAWTKATAVIGARLDAHKRRALAFAVLCTLDDDDLEEVLGHVFRPPDCGVAA